MWAVITPFKVIDYETKQKPTYHFLLANNNNLHPILNSFQVICSIGQIFAFNSGTLFNTFILGNLCEHYHKSYIAKN